MDKLKDWHDLRQRDVVELQNQVNEEANLSDEFRRALDFHDNLLTLGMLNDFVRLLDLVDLNQVRYREVKNKKLSAAGVEQEKGAIKFKTQIRNILDDNINQLIDILDNMEEEVYEQFKEEGSEQS